MHPDSTAAGRQRAAAGAAGADDAPSPVAGRRALDAAPSNRARDAIAKRARSAKKRGKAVARRASRDVRDASVTKMVLRLIVLYWLLVNAPAIGAAVTRAVSGSLRWLTDPAAVID